MLFSREDFRNMITDIRHYFLHLNNYKVGMLDVGANELKPFIDNAFRENRVDLDVITQDDIIFHSGPILSPRSDRNTVTHFIHRFCVKHSTVIESSTRRIVP